MPRNATETSVFVTPIVLPVGGDPRTSASVDTPIESIASRTKWLKDQILSDDLVTFTRLIPISRGAPLNAGGWFRTWSIGTGLIYWAISGSPPSSDGLLYTLNPPPGSIITSIRAGVQIAGGAASSGMVMSAYIQTPDKTTPGNGTSAQVGATQTSTTSSGTKILSISGVSAPISSDTQLLNIEIFASSGGTATSNECYWLELTYMHQQLAAGLVAL